MTIPQSLVQRYLQYFGEQYILIQAPGRINLIGEHTDYNNGWVLPAAIDRYMYFVLGKNDHQQEITLYSPHFDQTVTISLQQQDLEKQPEELPFWAKYLQAVALEMQARGHHIVGVQGVLHGDIPTGGGLSSSAALCSGFIFGLAYFNQLSISRLEMALIAQAAEHRVGLNCGIMDPYASLHGKANHLILLDCQTNHSSYVPLHLSEYSLVLIDSKVKHSLAADSGYNERRQSCERVVSTIKAVHPQVNSLRDVNFALLRQFENQLDAIDYKRAKYVLEENQRVHHAITALQQNRLATVGQYLYQSHYGLQHDYEVSVPELDLLVDLTKPFHEVLGARMVGGGFGGCTINLIKTSSKAHILDKITESYYLATSITPEVYEFNLVDGVHIHPLFKV